MHGVNLWWFVSLSDMKFEYRRSTQEKMEESLKKKEIKSYTIVHPDNPMYNKRLRFFTILSKESLLIGVIVIFRLHPIVNLSLNYVL